MKVVALIPARYDSTRFYGKMLARLGDKTVIRQTYERASGFGIFDEVYVVTDSDLIYDEIVGHGGKALKSIKKHETGTDRIAEAAENIEADIIFNIQGDEPFIKPEPLKLLINAFHDKSVDVATLVQKLDDFNHVNDPNYVKVVKDLNDFIMYFSRATIPYNRDSSETAVYYEHIGVYAFRRDALLKFSKLNASPLELLEKVEPIRFLENSMKIKVYETDYMGIEIDTEEDLINANKYLETKGIDNV
ncbi:MAG: 3-deoxy-manno-octulosonate cytidylyltransferase [Candidatus Kapabacteria bacterium]|nr:3-deoxy-manno-octulosonate cytidylyltransferase [Ignavibacteriota bacterium]MCW5886135.1 3-deoxy-manno-octulosonate cytidylyltransferase [Candidatus Kapabacteria bacterium]